MSDTPRTDALIYRKNTIEMQRHELLDLALALERELAEAKKALRVAVGLLLIMPQFSNVHPDDMLEAILKETRERK